MASLRALMTAALAAAAAALPGSATTSPSALALTPSPAPIPVSSSSRTSTPSTATPSSTAVHSSSGGGGGASGFSWTPAPSDQSTCGPPSFHASAPSASTSTAMPPADWRHCAALFSSWAGRNGTFAVHDGAGNATLYIPLLAGRGCVLGVRAGDDDDQGGNGTRTGDVWLTVGDRDVKGIMRTALEEWSSGTELEVQGEVRCATAEGGTGGLRWQIYGDKA